MHSPRPNKIDLMHFNFHRETRILLQEIMSQHAQVYIGALLALTRISQRSSNMFNMLVQ